MSRLSHDAVLAAFVIGLPALVAAGALIVGIALLLTRGRSQP